MEQITLSDFLRLHRGDTVFIKVGDEYLESKVLGKTFFNNQADEPDYEVLTSNGFTDCQSCFIQNEWFGIVRWCNDDIAHKLSEMGIEPTEDNIVAVRCACENNHHFTDTMIEAGWMAIECAIESVFASQDGGN